MRAATASRCCCRAPRSGSPPAWSLGQARPYAAPLAAIILSAWFGGFRPALLALALAILAINIYLALTQPEGWGMLHAHAGGGLRRHRPAHHRLRARPRDLEPRGAAAGRAARGDVRPGVARHLAAVARRPADAREPPHGRHRRPVDRGHRRPHLRADHPSGRLAVARAPDREGGRRRAERDRHRQALPAPRRHRPCGCTCRWRRCSTTTASPRG